MNMKIMETKICDVSSKIDHRPVRIESVRPRIRSHTGLLLFFTRRMQITFKNNEVNVLSIFYENQRMREERIKYDEIGLSTAGLAYL